MKDKNDTKKKKAVAITIVVAVVVAAALGLSFVPFFSKFTETKCPDWSNDRAVKGFVSCPGEANFWQHMNECMTYRNVDGACKWR